ncbi:hypothetical protein MAM1_0167d07073 [Mucor ambiguus]|uniref:Retrotransposon gag domain-containing protein n=1 Tax=Mucor ambiguus TaxID=91626 RepID=A0A0C9MZ67_9FUNG|nr:hypothetical protein MAM1_0167d07073 [Mucor ambiguus]
MSHSISEFQASNAIFYRVNYNLPNVNLPIFAITTNNLAIINDSPEQELSYEEAVERLREEVLGLVTEIADSSKTDEEVDALKAVMDKKCSKLTAIEKAISMVLPNQGPSPKTVIIQGIPKSSVVPVNLPLFQWFGRVKDEKKKNHELDLDNHLQRLLSPCLPDDLRNWLNGFLKVSGSSKTTWATLKGAIIGRFGTPRELLRCTKGNEESIDGFIERFKSLRARAEINDKCVVAIMVFFDAFPKDTARLLMVAMSQAPESSFYDIDYYVSSLVRKMDMMAMETGQESLESVFVGRKRDANLPVSNEEKKYRYAPSFNDNGIQIGSSSRSHESSQSSRSSNLHFGKTFSQHVADGTCAKCNGLRPKGQSHQCNTAICSGGSCCIKGPGKSHMEGQGAILRFIR